MNWQDVGGWLKNNAGTGAALVGSLLTGNVGGAIAAGVSLVSSATGTDDPTQAMEVLKNDPQAIVRLKELYYQNEAHIREQHRLTVEAQLLDSQKEHHETQDTIREGDKSEDSFIRRTRPGQSWTALFGAIGYVFVNNEPDVWVLFLLLTPTLTYMGLRGWDKYLPVLAQIKGFKK